MNIVLGIEPKSVQKGARYGRGRFYNDPKKNAYMDQIAIEASSFKPKEPMEGPLEIGFKFYMPRIKSLKYPGACPCWSYGSKNDWDNLCKGVQDALGKAGFFINDNQIWKCLGVERLYCEEWGFPRMEIELNQTTEMTVIDSNRARLTASQAIAVLKAIFITKSLKLDWVSPRINNLAKTGYIICVSASQYNCDFYMLDGKLTEVKAIVTPKYNEWSLSPEHKLVSQLTPEIISGIESLIEEKAKTKPEKRK